MTDVASRRRALWRGMLVYALCILIPLLALNAFLDRRQMRPSEFPLADSLRVKTQYYREHPKDFDLLLFGDSRTYCNMQPHLLDPLLGTRSVNLGTWGHYFATQLGQLEAIADAIPEGTTVLWSIGHRNFQPVDRLLWWDVFPAVQQEPFPADGAWWLDKYPIGLKNAPRFLWWGYPWHAVKRNVMRYCPLGAVFQQAQTYRFTWNRRRENPVAALDFFVTAQAETAPTPPPETPPAPGPHAATVPAELERLRANPDTARAGVMSEEGHPTSVAVYTRQGSYYRVELDRAFFRGRQQDLIEAIEAGRRPGAEAAVFEPSPPLWRNFLAILDCFQAHGLRVVVNEMEEAPFIYEAWGGRGVLRQFMRERVEPVVRERGIPYVRVDFDTLRDQDYFDFDHLNQVGLVRFTPMLADALRLHMKERP